MTTIYALRDPRDNAIRYIGKANSTALRLKYHQSRAKHGSQTPVHVWIQELAAAELKPIVEVLERVTKVEWKAAERKWIALYQEQLTNVGRGGESGPEKLIKAVAHLNIRLPDAEKVAYETAAAKRGLDVTTWVRIHLRRAAGLDA